MHLPTLSHCQFFCTSWKMGVPGGRSNCWVWFLGWCRIMERGVCRGLEFMWVCEHQIPKIVPVFGTFDGWRSGELCGGGVKPALLILLLWYLLLKPSYAARFHGFVLTFVLSLLDFWSQWLQIHIYIYSTPFLILSLTLWYNELANCAKNFTNPPRYL